ncbi:fluoride efflux transporter CrcB [Prevotella sp. OH937_COT-195]|uniref:fluoride efflux transporter CrcB n=1 Tax=Prevotella sp. OH937_COT-195 TaxID=2491051 RepID=UPI000F64A40C|nr:fluoride efflux transporter CrcB [Prevotella sp. OH937_COT-195]RRD02904.1 fluoride efflux transporter CrcB [Prevotella sp. OH937_COT-195]
MIRGIVLVALGGAAGSVGRYLVSRWLSGDMPWDTFMVNVIGSLLIGLLTGIVGRGILSADMKLLLVTGFCGGFTTFSTFAYESFRMMRSGEALLFAAYVGMSVAAGLMAVYAGLKISE